MFIHHLRWFLCLLLIDNGHLVLICLQWGARALKNMLIVPPGSGIVHQVNLEYLGRVVFDTDDVLYPDSLVGTDSHTTMINGLGIVGWGKILLCILCLWGRGRCICNYLQTRILTSKRTWTHSCLQSPVMEVENSFNPNTFTGMVGKVRKKEEGREGGEKHTQRAHGGRGSNLGPTACWGRVLSCTPRELFRQVSLSVALDRVGG